MRPGSNRDHRPVQATTARHEGHGGERAEDHRDQEEHTVTSRKVHLIVAFERGGSGEGRPLAPTRLSDIQMYVANTAGWRARR